MEVDGAGDSTRKEGLGGEQEMLRQQHGEEEGGVDLGGREEVKEEVFCQGARTDAVQQQKQDDEEAEASGEIICIMSDDEEEEEEQAGGIGQSGRRQQQQQQQGSRNEGGVHGSDKATGDDGEEAEEKEGEGGLGDNVGNEGGDGEEEDELEGSNDEQARRREQPPAEEVIDLLSDGDE
jgi:hypothetical protein